MTINIIGPNDPALDVMAATLKQQPEYDAQLTIVPFVEYHDRLMAALTANVSPEQAVFVPGHVWIPDLAASGYLAPLDSLLKQVDADARAAYDEDNLLPIVAAEVHFDNKPYQIPFFSDGHILFYRSDLIDLEDQEGVPVVSPGDLLEMAANAHNPPDVYGIALKAHSSEIFLDWLPFLWDTGGELLDAQGAPAVASEAGVKALQLYCDLRQYCPEDTHDYGNAEIATVLKEGKAALVTTWGGQAAPVFLDESNAYRDLYQAAVFPIPWNATWGVAIPANQPEDVQVTALQTLLQIMEPAVDREITRVAGSPVRQSSYSSSELEKYSWLAAQHEMLKRTRLLPIAPETGQYLGALYGAVYAAFTGEMTPADALTKAAEEMRKVLKK